MRPLQARTNLDFQGIEHMPVIRLRLAGGPTDHRLDQLERLIARLAPGTKKTFKDSWDSD